MSEMNRVSGASTWMAVAIAAASLVCPVPVQAQACDSLKSYGAYAICCASAGRKPISVSSWVRARGLAAGSAQIEIRAADETPGNPLARQPYRDEMTRHDGLRSRAEALSQSPRMRSYQSRVQDLRADDDRKIKAFELQSRPSGGSAAALPGLKRHNDSLEKMVAQAQGLVDR